MIPFNFSKPVQFPTVHITDKPETSEDLIIISLS
jgi:hypothetical protein